MLLINFGFGKMETNIYYLTLGSWVTISIQQRKSVILGIAILALRRKWKTGRSSLNININYISPKASFQPLSENWKISLNNTYSSAYSVIIKKKQKIILKAKKNMNIKNL